MDAEAVGEGELLRGVEGLDAVVLGVGDQHQRADRVEAERRRDEGGEGAPG